MNTEFSRTLSLLRQERGVSQRTAAGDLGISQALLSHYENGIREPGLAFVVRACEYYHVSADFILGRTLSREGGALTDDDILNMADQGNILRGSVLATLQSKLISGAVSVLFDLLGKLNDKAAVNEAAQMLNGAIYILFRRLHRASGGNEAMFSAPAELVSMGLPAAEMKLAEARYVRVLETLRAQGNPFPEITGETLGKNYPGSGQCITQVLHSADAKTAGLMKE
ncbi:MAG: helix-turn-helix transcriptional regulator [Oscillibacter sp.]|nr:helix-turn-helix transcriptional regulator [Oscillibacter sp.]